MTTDGRYLAGAHAVVTGGGRGIGAAIASELARLGASVTIMGRSEEALREHAERLRAEHGGEHHAERCDVTDDGSVELAFAHARERAGDPHVLVNNAGAAESAKFTDTSRELWDRMLLANLTSAFLCTRQVLPAMLAAKRGRIVNVASTAAVSGASRIVAYSAAKHGVVGLTRSLAAETAKHGVTVNAVCPGYTDTGMAQTAIDNLVRGLGRTPEEARRMIESTTPRGRLIEPAEIASMVGWLCSPLAAAITGQAIVLNGGEP